jgi:tetratricopeptide (TPR) repeat protein
VIRAIWCAALALALCSVTSLVAPRAITQADTGPEIAAAKRHYNRGEKLFALGKFREAMDAYQAAYDEKPFPAFLFNIGQCHRNLGDYEAAIFSFRKYLDLAPNAENKEQVAEYIRELETEQEKTTAKRLDLVDKTPRRQPEPGPEPKDDESSIVTRWWFWTAVGVVAVGGGVGIYVATRSESAPSTDLGNIVFRR